MRRRISRGAKRRGASIEAGLILGGLGLAAIAAARTALRRQFSLTGRVVAITGGGRGLGLALAREYASRGARIAICGRHEAELAAARRDLSSRGAAVHAHACDLTRREEAEAWVDTVRRELGEIDVLVNNAGVIGVGPLETMRVEDFEAAMRIHFHAPLQLTLAVLPHMRRQRSGRIVNISSFGGLIGVPRLAPYCASKFALTGFSESIRTELATQGVFVSTICPFLMRTGSPRHALFKGDQKTGRAWFNAAGVMPLLTMHPDRAARKIVEASNQGRAELVLTPQGKAAVWLKAMFPGLVLGAAAAINRLVPGADGDDPAEVEGTQIELTGARAIIEWLNRRAGARLNEYVR